MSKSGLNNMVSTEPTAIEMFNAEEHRAVRLITDAIDRLDLSLEGLRVLTEVGTNNYLYTPIIAALAGAEQVYAWTADTSYGKGSDTIRLCQALASKLNVLNRIEFINNERIADHIRMSNIITNSGFLRPIDSDFLKYVDPTNCVLPLMYEAWEWREADVDLDACRRAGIRVAGTWENHPALRIFDATGPLAVKLAMGAGFEVYRNNIAVWSSDDFGAVAANTYRQMGAESVVQTTEKIELSHILSELDFVYFCDYGEKLPLVGRNGIIELAQIRERNPGLGIIHLFGELEYDVLASNGLRVYPPKTGIPHFMTETLAHLGIEPLLNLVVAGFKVGQSLFFNEPNDFCQLL
jgi:hypothetical protein